MSTGGASGTDTQTLSSREKPRLHLPQRRWAPPPWAGLEKSLLAIGQGSNDVTGAGQAGLTGFRAAEQHLAKSSHPRVWCEARLSHWRRPASRRRPWGMPSYCTHERCVPVTSGLSRHTETRGPRSPAAVLPNPAVREQGDLSPGTRCRSAGAEPPPCGTGEPCGAAAGIGPRPKTAPLPPLLPGCTAWTERSAPASRLRGDTGGEG